MVGAPTASPFPEPVSLVVAQERLQDDEVGGVLIAQPARLEQKGDLGSEVGNAVRRGPTDGTERSADVPPTAVIDPLLAISQSYQQW